MLVLLDIAVLLSTASAYPTGPNPATVAAKVQPLLSTLASHFNASFAFGWAPPGWSSALPQGDLRVALAAGMDGPSGPLQVSTRIPSGSATKAWTGAAIFQLIDDGKLTLATKVAPLLDSILRAGTSLSFAALWAAHGGAQAALVDVDDLLGMTSGIADYDNGQIFGWSMEHSATGGSESGSGDIDPFTMLQSVNKTFLCTRVKESDAKCAGYYSSINYVLLGFIVVHFRNVKTWEEWDQRDVLLKLPSARVRETFANITFPTSGPCSSIPRLSHQYGALVSASLSKDLSDRDHIFYDIDDYSCLNGWTMGNGAFRAVDLASFQELLWTPGQLLSATTIAMLDDAPKPLTNDWANGLLYGRATENSDFAFLANGRPDPKGLLKLRGHAGEDWGSGAPLAHQHAAYGFGIALTMGSTQGMNCSQGFSASDNAEASGFAACAIFHAVLSLYPSFEGETAPTLDCLLLLKNPLLRAKFKAAVATTSTLNTLTVAPSVAPTPKPTTSDAMGTCSWSSSFPLCKVCGTACTPCKPCALSKTGKCAGCWSAEAGGTMLGFACFPACTLSDDLAAGCWGDIAGNIRKIEMAVAVGLAGCIGCCCLFCICIPGFIVAFVVYKARKSRVAKRERERGRLENVAMAAGSGVGSSAAPRSNFESDVDGVEDGAAVIDLGSSAVTEEATVTGHVLSANDELSTPLLAGTVVLGE